MEEQLGLVTGERVDRDPKTASLFEALYHEHVDYVYNVAFRLTGQQAEADDLTQDTFLRAYRYLDGFAGSSPKSWLRRIAVNLFFNRCKSRGREVVTSLDVSDEEVNSRRVQRALVDEASNPSECLDQLSLDERLQRALDSLPADFRVVLVMREIDDLTYDQIASLVGVPIGTVRSRLARARTALRERLGRQGS
jgi:RNA polymerase sigma-70 factor, ECF subfamily